MSSTDGNGGQVKKDNEYGFAVVDRLPGRQTQSSEKAAAALEFCKGNEGQWVQVEVHEGQVGVVSQVRSL